MYGAGGAEGGRLYPEGGRSLCAAADEHRHRVRFQSAQHGIFCRAIAAEEADQRQSAAMTPAHRNEPRQIASPQIATKHAAVDKVISKPSKGRPDQRLRSGEVCLIRRRTRAYCRPNDPLDQTAAADGRQCCAGRSGVQAGAAACRQHECRRHVKEHTSGPAAKSLSARRGGRSDREVWGGALRRIEV